MFKYCLFAFEALYMVYFIYDLHMLNNKIIVDLLFISCERESIEFKMC